MHYLTLNMGPSSPQMWEIWGSEPPVRSDAAYWQITLTFVYQVDRELGNYNRLMLV